MLRPSCIFTLLFCSFVSMGQSPVPKIKATDFFKDERLLEITISTNIKELRKKTSDPAFQPAMVSVLFPDSSLVHEPIRLRRRGNFRNENCYIASLMLDFKNPGSPRLSPLKKLKWVGGCSTGNSAGQFVLKEYLAYKIYNLITDRSFRVRLVKANYRDTLGKVKPFSQYAFLIEDIAAVAKRNNCVEKKGVMYHTEWTNRNQMTIVAMFQYMIGNTDWAVPYYHNIKLIVDKKDTLSKPFVIPYDFDYCGFVNPPYAVPPEHLGITEVTQRLYRGFPRTIEEQEAAAEIFKANESRINDMIDQWDLLEKGTKSDMHHFLQDYFRVIKDKDAMEHEFIEKARTN